MKTTVTYWCHSGNFSFHSAQLIDILFPYILFISCRFLWSIDKIKEREHNLPSLMLFFTYDWCFVISSFTVLSGPSLCALRKNVNKLKLWPTSLSPIFLMLPLICRICRNVWSSPLLFPNHFQNIFTIKTVSTIPHWNRFSTPSHVFSRIYMKARFRVYPARIGKFTGHDWPWGGDRITGCINKTRFLRSDVDATIVFWGG